MKEEKLVKRISGVSHKNIVKFYECLKIEKNNMNTCYIIMEYCNEKTLEKLQEEKKKLEEKKAPKFLSQIIRGY